MTTRKATSTETRYLKWCYVLPALGVLYFVIAGILLAPYPGIENDEALFATGIYEPTAAADTIQVFGKNLVTMMMSYVGALKCWIYIPILYLVEPSAYSLRVPVILGGVVAIWLCWLYLRRISGFRAAVIGSVLLATDAGFLITATFDWGPVVLQHVLLLGGLVLLLEFRKREDWRFLAAAFLVFGVATWDKAIFAWMFSGIVVSGVIFFGREIWRLITWRRCVIVILFFLIGAWPLVRFNLQNDFQTFRGKQYSFKDFHQKVTILGRTVNGSALLGFLIHYGPEPVDKEPVTALEKASVKVSEATGHVTGGWLPYALMFAVLAAAVSWRTQQRRLLLFFVLAFSISWFQMLITETAGAGAHHTILLWPHVVGFVAVALSGFTERFGRIALSAVSVAVLLVAGSNILVMNEYLTGLIRFGPTRMWTDAVFPLGDYLRRSKPGIVYAGDWGMGDTMRFFLQDYPPVGDAVEPFDREELDDSERNEVMKRITYGNSVFVNYVEGRAGFSNAKRLLLECALENGYRRETLRLIPDSRGRPVFEVYRFVRT